MGKRGTTPLFESLKYEPQAFFAQCPNTGMDVQERAVGHEGDVHAVLAEVDGGFEADESAAGDQRGLSCGREGDLGHHTAFESRDAERVREILAECVQPTVDGDEAHRSQRGGAGEDGPWGSRAQSPRKHAPQSNVRPTDRVPKNRIPRSNVRGIPPPARNPRSHSRRSPQSQPASPRPCP